MANKKVVSEIEKLNEWEKLTIYFNYRAVQKALFYFTELIDINSNNNHFFETVNYPILRATESKIQKIDKTMSFKDFVSKDKNIKNINYGNSIQTVYSGIYEWYNKCNYEYKTR